MIFLVLIAIALAIRNNNSNELRGATGHDPVIENLLHVEEQTVLAPQDAFHFDIVCEGITTEQCNIALINLNRAGRRMGEAILFKRQINVTAKFLPFVSGSPQENGVGLERIAYANPTKYYAGRNNYGQLLMYPKALLKQSYHDILPEYVHGADIEVIFNSHANWYFGDNLQLTPTDQFSISRLYC